MEIMYKKSFRKYSNKVLKIKNTKIEVIFLKSIIKITILVEYLLLNFIA
jgi:hypothetical protein